MKQRKVWNIISAIFWLAQFAAEAAAAVTIWRLNMVPGKYFMLLIALLLAALLITGLMLFLRKKEKGRYAKKTNAKQGNVRRVIACILAVAVIVGCGAVTSVVSKLHQTVTAITKPTVISSTYAVYVLAEDPAQTLKDAGGYTFATAATAYDAEDVQKAVTAVQNELGREITTSSCVSVPAMVDALYNEDVGAIIMNLAYVDVLEDNEVYGGFSGKTKVLYEIPIETPEDMPEATEPAVSAPDDGGKVDEPAGEETLKPFILYLSGSDTRSKMLVTSRSDVNILAVVNPETKQILLVNTPRDYFVPNPAGGGVKDKLTHCGIYGIQCSVDALSGLYNVPIDYYAQINFTGFETLIDAIGGVTLYSDVDFSTSQYTFHAGDNNLNGAQALSLARERYAFAAGDNARGQNQMKVIKAVIAKLSSSTVITKYSGIMDSLQGMFVTDVPMELISQLVKMQLSDMAKWNVQSYAVTGSGGSDITYSMPGLYCYVMYPHEDTVENASSLINRVLTGETLTEEDVKPIR